MRVKYPGVLTDEEIIEAGRRYLEERADDIETLWRLIKLGIWVVPIYLRPPEPFNID